MRTRISVFISVVQSVLFLSHGLIFATCVFFFAPLRPAQLAALGIVLAALSLIFVPASALAFRSYNFAVRVFYILAAVWIGLVDFLFVACCACWIVYFCSWVFRLRLARSEIALVFFALGVLSGVYGIVNAAWPRVIRLHVTLPGLPPAWRGRTAALLSDTHLGHVRGPRFFARLVAILQTLGPDIVFFPGDMYDGTHVDPDLMAAPWKKLSPPFGSYFVVGNHEEFLRARTYPPAAARAGMRVLHNEKVVVDGLQIVGVNFADSHGDAHFRAILERAALDPARASILLLHAPRQLALAEQFGISLQLCGHTHGGQIFPFTWFTHRIFGAYTHGLRRFGRMAVYTTYGAGTWGPPMRVGTRPEIVLIHFD